MQAKQKHSICLQTQIHAQSLETFECSCVCVYLYRQNDGPSEVVSFRPVLPYASCTYNGFMYWLQLRCPRYIQPFNRTIWAGRLRMCEYASVRMYVCLCHPLEPFVRWAEAYYTLEKYNTQMRYHLNDDFFTARADCWQCIYFVWVHHLPSCIFSSIRFLSLIRIVVVSAISPRAVHCKHTIHEQKNIHIGSCSEQKRITHQIKTK